MHFMSILSEAGLADSYQMKLSKTYPQHEYVVQYQETDLDFVCRLMEKAGIWFFF